MYSAWQKLKLTDPITSHINQTQCRDLDCHIVAAGERIECINRINDKLYIKYFKKIIIL